MVLDAVGFNVVMDAGLLRVVLGSVESAVGDRMLSESVAAGWAWSE